MQTEEHFLVQIVNKETGKVLIQERYNTRNDAQRRKIKMGIENQHLSKTVRDNIKIRILNVQQKKEEI